MRHHLSRVHLIILFIFAGEGYRAGSEHHQPVHLQGGRGADRVQAVRQVRYLYHLHTVSVLYTMSRSALLSVVSHSLSAYITTLESLPLQRLSSRIAAEVSMWMCDLFHFPDGLAHCHDDIREGLVRVVRLVLNVNYPNLISDGFIALAASPPVRTCCCIVDMMVL